MALTPEDVLNKTFTQTQFRRGYDERAPCRGSGFVSLRDGGARVTGGASQGFVGP